MIENQELKINETTPSEVVELYNFIESINSAEYKTKFICALKDNISLLAALFEYDCLYDKKFPSIIILNRKKIVVSESEAAKIAENSENYKNIKTQ